MNMTMGGPSWLADFFAGLMLAVALYSTGRLVAARLWSRPTHVDIDATHVLMGVTMAGMLVDSLSFGSAGFWEIVFGLNAAWFAYRTVQALSGKLDHPLSHFGTHLVMAGAMIYMYVNPTTTGLVWLPLLFVVALLLSGVWEVDARANRSVPLSVAARQPALIGGPGASASGSAEEDRTEHTPEVTGTADSTWLAPRLEAASHVAMCVTMGYMLVLML